MTGDHAAELRAVLENELVWRQDEMRSLRNWQYGIKRDELLQGYRRAMIVMLYAHLEGFTKIALGEYVRFINRAEVSVSKVKKELAAAFLSREFTDYRKPLPGDKQDPESKKARQVTKDAELFQIIVERAKSIVYLDADEVISSDSNLNMVVLRRNLTRLGLDDSWARDFASDVNSLLGRRNAIAHGDSLKIPSEEAMYDMENTVFSLCSSLSRNVFRSARNGDFLR